MRRHSRSNSNGSAWRPAWPILVASLALLALPATVDRAHGAGASATSQPEIDRFLASLDAIAGGFVGDSEETGHCVDGVAWSSVPIAFDAAKRPTKTCDAVWPSDWLRREHFVRDMQWRADVRLAALPSYIRLRRLLL